MNQPSTDPLKPGLAGDELARLLGERFGLERDARVRGTACMICPADRLREVALHLRDDGGLRFAMLIDVAGIDYLAYPQHRGPRFAVVYLFKSLVHRHRVALKVLLEEDAANVPSLQDLFRSADWAEREVWDQYGIVFTGHTNLKRLLNHHEFVGHPLRKDYPCQKRQKLSLNDPMIDQLEARLKERGYSVLDRGESHVGMPLTFTRPAGRRP
jgi:NADH-quinone oxidoreductase subunit C